MCRLPAALFFLLCFFTTIEDIRADEVVTTTNVFGDSLSWLNINQGHLFAVIVDDQVKDSCWTNTTAVKTAVQLELKRSGYNLNSEHLPPETIIILSSLGYETTSLTCAVTFRFEAFFWSNNRFVSRGHEVESPVLSTLWMKNGLFSGLKKDMNARLKQAYVDMVQEFLIKIDVMKKQSIEAIRNEAKGKAKKFWDNYKLD